MSVLNPLSSDKSKFSWTSEHDNAFDKIKEILNMDLNYQEPDSDDSIKIIYSDASESTLGAILFSSDISHYRLNPPDFLSDHIPETYKKHIMFYKISCKTVISQKHDSIFENFIHLLTYSQNFHEIYDYSEHNISFF